MSAPEERLRSLGLDSSPAAGRLRARVTRPRCEPGPVVSVPRAPYAAEEAAAPYRLEEPRDETVPARSPRREPPGSGGGRKAEKDQRTGQAPPVREGNGTTPGTSEARTPEEGSGERHRRAREPARPPSGYTELDPEAAVPLLERVARGWGARASLSRRSVVTLLVLGLLAAAVAFWALRERPEEVTVPELVTRSAPADQSTDGPADEGEGAGRPAPSGPGTGGDTGGDTGGEVVVHVGGEVAEPGLYTLPSGSRVADAVQEAGGPLPDADLDLVNLARSLTDGERILVGVPQPEGGPGGGPAGAGPPVNLNLAGQNDLETLPGIGEKRAQQILTHRESLGGSFSSVEDLLGVDGIGEKTFRTLEPHVTVG
ncbi:helix-hairpin-helix domain-containing protein [Nocardiopsis terrae]